MYWVNNQKLFVFSDDNNYTDMEVSFSSYVSGLSSEKNSISLSSRVLFLFRNRFRKSSKNQYEFLFHEFIRFYRTVSLKFKNLMKIVLGKELKKISEFNPVLYLCNKKFYISSSDGWREKVITISAIMNINCIEDLSLDKIKFLIELKDSYSVSLDIRKNVLMNFDDFYNFLLVCNEIRKNFLVLSAQSYGLAISCSNSIIKDLNGSGSDAFEKVTGTDISDTNVFKNSLENYKDNTDDVGFLRKDLSTDLYEDELSDKFARTDFSGLEIKDSSSFDDSRLFSGTEEFIKKFERIKSTDYFGLFLFFDKFLHSDISLLFNFLSFIYDKKKCEKKDYFYPSIVLYEKYKDVIFSSTDIENVYYLQYARNVLLFLSQDKYKINYIKFRLDTCRDVSDKLLYDDGNNELFIYIVEILFLLSIFKSFSVCNSNKDLLEDKDKELFDRISAYYRYFFILFGIDVASILCNISDLSGLINNYLLRKIRIIFDKYIYFGLFSEIESRFLDLFISSFNIERKDTEYYNKDSIFRYIENSVYTFVKRFEVICKDVREFSIADKGNIVSLLKKENIFVPDHIEDKADVCISDLASIISNNK